ncbi:MAG: DJ-1/PfpI family protein [Lachnospiraceae bacterium]|jgi:4-methyl-5(b-hydroxyethyl)-thiazole monophosphate biosynthesis|nr:DJ-1/PfpI family protein [Lachnospiraceae bacterium]MDE6990081.1 DJ-1/PfpI family protein [Lachnospiraceae bacterium]MDE7001970.1 DJ-1/PfpI family protein [Lachnospiraceae bacterium]
MKKRAAVFFATGFEEIEALTAVDLLRRAGIETACVSIDNEKRVTGSHNITVEMDAGLDRLDFGLYDILICPGGMPGTKNLEACEWLTKNIRASYQNGKYIAAICAAPSIFAHMGLLQGRKACIYPGMEDELYQNGAGVCSDSKVMKSGTIITSRGLGTAIPFALEIVAALLGQEKADELARSIVYTED